ncbi:VOC family protein [Companilactobacillus mishanensis]
MLYVDDVELIADFFKDALNAEIIKKTKLQDGSFELKLKVLDQVNINLYNVDFIKNFSPMVSLETPSIMFLTDDVEATHEQISKYSKDVGDIMVQGCQKVFNFSDPEGHYFAIGTTKD